MRGLLGFASSVFCAAAVQAAEVHLDAAGADSGLQDDLRTSSLTVSAAQDPTSTPQDLLAAARADYARLIGILYGQGYYSPVIHITVDGREAASVTPFSAPASIKKLVLQVAPGPRFVFGRARVAPLAAGTQLPEGFASGQVAQSTLIKDAATAGVTGWRDAGYAKANVAGQRIVADHRAQVLNADISLYPGPKLTFGALLIDGKTRVRPARVHAIAGLPSGEVFSPDEVQRAANRLRKSGAFRSVSLSEAETANPNGSLDITAALVDEKKRRLGAGIELSSTEGLKLSGYWLHRNLLRGAERLRLDAEVGGIGGDSGGIDYKLGASLTRPATFTASTTLVLSAALEQLDEPDYFEQNIRLGATLNREINDQITVGAGIGYRYSDVRDDLGENVFNHLTFPITGTMDKRDNTLNPAGGYYVDLTVEPFIGLDSSESGARLFAQTRAYFSLNKRFVLAGRVQFGSVLGAGSDEVPPDMLFFSGGGGTVRGQPYQSLGVDQGGGDTVGGRGFMGLSAEMRIGLNDKIGIVGFADAGYISADSTPWQGGEWQSGAGLGLRYNTGIGPIRLDVAAPVGGNTGDGMQFYIGIGQAF